jgi:hypothetical protein
MELDVAEQKLACFDAPPKYKNAGQYVLVTAEDGNQLGFARSSGTRIVPWTRVSDPDADGAVAWAEPETGSSNLVYLNFGSLTSRIHHV